MFRSVPDKPNITQMEDALIRYWKTWQIAQKCEEQRRGGGEFVYYEKPPSPHGKPELSHAITRAFSDIFLRYKTMRGYHILRRSGWQAHGLPMELMVAKQLGLMGKERVEEYGVDKFIQKCSDFLDYYAPYWERMNDHLAYWLNPLEAYVTFSNEFTESVWWAIKSLWDKGLLYSSLKVMPYCPSCGVYLSEGEAAQNCKEALEMSAVIRLPLVNGPGTSLLVMTQAAWTLVGNVAVAVNPDAEYITIEQEAPGGGIENLIVAEKSAKKIFGDAPLRIVDQFKGKKLKGEAYFPLYTFIIAQKAPHIVIVDDRIQEAFGTGLKHIAPTFSEQDLQLAQEYDLPILNPLTDAGTFIPEVRPWSGKVFYEVNPIIVEDLQARGLLFSVESCMAEQPHCPYCSAPIIDYAGSGWFIRFSQYQDELLHLADMVVVSSGSAENTNLLDANIFTDRMLSYHRFWGTPLPIWECQACHYQHCLGSREELIELAGKRMQALDWDYTAIDELILECPECGGQLKRIPDLVNPWFESSCMPFAQWHYPFEEKAVFETQFPADMICTTEARNDNWLEDCLVVNGILFGKAAFKHVLNPKTFMPNWDEKNVEGGLEVVEPFDVMKAFGADVWRWHLLDCWQTESREFAPLSFLSREAIQAAQQAVSAIWNVYSFFVTQANWFDWYLEDTSDRKEWNLLDCWLWAEINSLTRNITIGYETIDPHAIVTALTKFIDKLNGWYLTQSKQRIHLESLESGKSALFTVLYKTLLTLGKLIAPLTPFLSEEIYQNLVANSASANPNSIHLTDWPVSDSQDSDETLIVEMDEVINLASLGKAVRCSAGIPIHQPLAEIAFLSQFAPIRYKMNEYADLLKNELNVKNVIFLDSRELFEEYLITHEKKGQWSQVAYQVALDTRLTQPLIEEGVVNQVISGINDLRLQMGIAEFEPIRLYLKSTPRLMEALFRNRQMIIGKAAVVEMIEGLPAQKEHTSRLEINGDTIVVGVEKHP